MPRRSRPHSFRVIPVVPVPPYTAVLPGAPISPAVRPFAGRSHGGPAMRRLLPKLAAGLIAALAGAAPAAAQFQYVFATPLPPGPGTVPIVPNSTLAAPVLLPAMAPTAAPVAIYTYGQPQMAATAATAPVPPMAPAPGPDCSPTVAGCEQPKRCGGRFWVAADFFYGASQSVWLPPLVTLAPPGTPPPG